MSLPLKTLEAFTKHVWAAANDRSICSLKLAGENGFRTVYPHGIFIGKDKKLTMVCWQKSGYSAKGVEKGYKTLLVEKFENVMVLNKKFVKRRDFNPKEARYGTWLFHI